MPCAIHWLQMTRDAVFNQVCILWHDADETPADPLVKVLCKRGFAVMPTASIHTVFAVACRYAKSAKRVVIVFDDRSALIGADRLLDALERFAPSVICWEHRHDANPPMVPVVPVVPILPRVRQTPVPSSSSESEPTNLAERTVIGTQAKAKLRLVGDDESDSSKSAVSLPKASDQKVPINARDVLDADELDALLAGELGEEPGQR